MEKFDCPRTKGTMRLGAFAGRVRLAANAVKEYAAGAAALLGSGNGRLARGALKRGLVENIFESIF